MGAIKLHKNIDYQKEYQEKKNNTPKNKHIIDYYGCNYIVEKVVEEFNTQQDLPLRNQLRASHIFALQKLISIYGVKLNKFLSPSNPLKYFKGNQNHPSATTVEHGLAYYAKCFNVSSRTAQRYLHRLEQAGMIIKTQRYTQIQIQINPILLMSFDENAEIFNELRLQLSQIFAVNAEKLQKKLNTENQSLNKSKTTSCRIKYMTRYYNNLINEVVDKDKCKPTHPINESNTQEIYQDTQLNKEKTLLFGHKSRTKREAERRAEQRKMLIETKVNSLWTWHYENLYKNTTGTCTTIKFLTKTEKKYAINYYTEQFTHTPDRLIQKRYDFLLTRLKKWHKHITKLNGIGFTPVPSTFLNPANPKGFAITEFWMYKNAQKQAFNNYWNKLSTLIRKIQEAFNKPIAMAEKQIVFEAISHRKKGIMWKAKQNKLITDTLLNQLENNYTAMVERVITKII